MRDPDSSPVYIINAAGNKISEKAIKKYGEWRKPYETANIRLQRRRLESGAFQGKRL